MFLQEIPSLQIISSDEFFSHAEYTQMFHTQKNFAGNWQEIFHFKSGRIILSDLHESSNSQLDSV